MADTFRILITTDNHVGYQENDPVRGDDSWKSFEEIMYIAKERDVDFVLQAGDLFHVNKPTKKSMFHVMKTLRSVCYGDKPIEFEIVSDPSLAIDNRGLNHANFQDPNINVSIPFFAIAGNHDDSTGDELLDAMDLLSVSGLINHFGKNLENDRVTVAPLLLQKGSTKLALYGLSNIRDERLYKTFLDGNVKFLRAAGKHQDSFFNLLSVHQNHSAHTDTSYLPESFLPNFLDFIVWGHEHECIPYLTPAPNGGSVLQPGSSVATSLSPGETLKKHVFILSVTGMDYKLEAVPLKTPRPFLMKNIDLTESDILPGSGNKNEVIRYLTEEIEMLIKEADENWLQLNREEEDNEEDEITAKPPLPLIRLKVEYTDDYQIENPRRFSNRFVGQIANVNDVILLHRKKVVNKNTKRTTKKDSKQEEDTDSQNVNVATLIDSFLVDDELNIISKDEITDAIKVFIEKEDKNALKDFIKLELERDFEKLLKLDEGGDMSLQDEDIPAAQSLSQLKKGFKEILKEMAKEKKLEEKRTEQLKSQRKQTVKSSEIVMSSDSDFEMSPEVVSPKPRLTLTRATKKQEVLEIVSNSDQEIYSDDMMSDDDDLIDVPPPRQPEKRGKVTKLTKLTKLTTKKTKKPTTGESQNVMDLVRKLASKK